jgi:hypothetical protein
MKAFTYSQTERAFFGAAELLYACEYRSEIGAAPFARRFKRTGAVRMGEVAQPLDRHIAREVSLRN